MTPLSARLLQGSPVDLWVRQHTTLRLPPPVSSAGPLICSLRPSPVERTAQSSSVQPASHGDYRRGGRQGYFSPGDDVIRLLREREIGRKRESEREISADWSNSAPKWRISLPSSSEKSEKKHLILDQSIENKVSQAVGIMPVFLRYR